MRINQVSKLLFSLLLLSFYSCEESKDQMFTKLSSGKTGIEFRNTIKETKEFNMLSYMYLYNGGGVAVGDINNDGLQDIYFSGNLVANRMYLNKGNMEFEDITKKAGLEAAGLWNTGVTMADVNGDGLLDIYVCRSAAVNVDYRRNKLFINNGDLTFREASAEYNLDDPSYTTQAAFFDYDLDGDLDVYLLNHSLREHAGVTRSAGLDKTRKAPYFGDKLYENDNGIFVDVSYTAGILNNVLGFGLGIGISDINADGWPDIYVSNDFHEEDYLYLNQKDGTFEQVSASYLSHHSVFSMGCDIADINNDEKVDIFTLDMLPEDNYGQKMAFGAESYNKYHQLLANGFHHQTMRNMLHVNNGDGTFSEIGQLAGVSNTDWSWSALMADFDNDGWKDIFITNGIGRYPTDMDFMNYVVSLKVKSAEKIDQNLLEIVDKMPITKVHNYMYRNNGDLTFTDESFNWGFDEKNLTNGAAYADFDNDGDLDLVVNNINEQGALYQNNSEVFQQNNYIKIKLKGNKANQFGIGAKVKLKVDGKSYFQEMQPVRGFQSATGYELVFGLGKASKIDHLEVTWPDGSVSDLSNQSVNQSLVIDQENATTPEELKSEEKAVLFQKADNKLDIDFKHKENEYLDFKRDRLIPQGYSNLGPKMAIGDVNGDALEDIYFGGAKGFSGQLFIQQRDGKFKLANTQAFEEQKASEEVSALFFDADQDNDLDLYVVSGGNEFEQTNPALQDKIYFNDGKGNFSLGENKLPKMISSGSQVSAADIDADGDQDLFVGGRITPGAYPVPPQSYILLNDGKGNFSDVTSNFAPDLVNPGMVTDAQFLEINGDNFPDLFLVGEWMAPTVLINKNGSGFELSTSGELAGLSGWWNAIHAADMDMDGDLDLVLGNFGNNNQYRPTEKHPVSMIYKDFDQNGSIDPILCCYIQGENHFAYSRDELIGQLAGLKKKFPDYASFGKASPASFFDAEQAKGADTLKALTFETVYLENKGNGSFEIHQLPVQAQFAPVFGITSTDVNGDGNLDLILAGNQSLTRVSTGKFEANYGQVFLGDGQGNFTYLADRQSGLAVKGDVRDIKKLKINNREFIMFSRNNDSVVSYELN
ncbi:VCBS repeat-containing protein [Flexithrix dorotheae]|uniref:VCBS repeat-containing protein n=1 Tax=Flexithrix dorotheae TaxID=70993 RepID=UPI0004774672|nr:VCBS repeat-containing protein [Flexithrix dorotheae]